MTTDSSYSNLDYPSLGSVDMFWEKAKEEFESDSIIVQKQACEKAYRAATEAVDVLLAAHGKYVPVGQANAHIIRAECLYLLRSIDTRIKILDDQYSVIKDKLHGLVFYTGFNPQHFKDEFKEVGKFIVLVNELIENNKQRDSEFD